MKDRLHKFACSSVESLASVSPPRMTALLLVATLVSVLNSMPAEAQLPNAMIGQAVHRDVRELYDRGLNYLIKTQSNDGSWKGQQGGAGVTGLCAMTFLATGEDPNFGKYSSVIRKAIKNIIKGQNRSTGYYGGSMYHHGFAMLAMAEAYGSVDDRKLWDAADGKQISIAESLELAVRCATTSQNSNPSSAWRYSPGTNSADTSVSGAVLVGLLAARNAGVAVPDENIKKAISYYEKLTSSGGEVGYSGIGGHGSSDARSSIACLVFALAKRKELKQFEATLDYLRDRLEASSNSHYAEYTLYYRAQALFQGDIEAWQKWNKLTIKRLKAKQQPDGSINGNYGPAVGTSMSLLSLALNFRLLPIYER